MPTISDWGEGNRTPTVRAGSPATFRFFIGVKDECLDLKVTGPDGPIDAMLLGSSTTFLTSTPGRYDGTVALKTSPLGRTYSLWVLAVAPPPNLEPCATLPRPCTTVVDAQRAFACDDTLLDRDGGVLHRLDGGLWFGSNDLLFGWHDGVLEQFETRDGGVFATASVPLPAAPRRWSVSSAGLALVVEDGGVVWERTLSAAPRSFAIEPDLRAISLFEDGGVLLVHGRDACMAGGDCAVGVANAGVAAVDRSGVWVREEFAFWSTALRRYERTPNGWQKTAMHADDGLLLPMPVPRRPVFDTVWGLTVLGRDGLWLLDEATHFGVADEVLWRSSPTMTRVWCY